MGIDDLLTAGGDLVQGFFGIDPNTKDSILAQVGTAAGNILGFDPESDASFPAQLGQALGGLFGLGGGSGATSGIGGLLGGGGMGGLLMAGLPAYYLGKAAMEEAKNDRGVPLIPLTQETGAGRYNIEAEIRRRMGLPAPNPVEFGMLPTGTLPELSGGKPSQGVSYEFASQTVPNLERPTPAAGRIPGSMIQRYRKGGIVELAEGGSPKIEIEIETEDGESMDASEFERMNGDINGEGTEISDDVPAMLSDGEYVMTGRAVRGAGAYDLNVGEGGIITLTPGGEESRERGTDLMYQMMALFEEFAAPPEED